MKQWSITNKHCLFCSSFSSFSSLCLSSNFLSVIVFSFLFQTIFFLFSFSFSSLKILLMFSESEYPCSLWSDGVECLKRKEKKEFPFHSNFILLFLLLMNMWSILHHQTNTFGMKGINKLTVFFEGGFTSNIVLDLYWIHKVSLFIVSTLTFPLHIIKIKIIVIVIFIVIFICKDLSSRNNLLLTIVIFTLNTSNKNKQFNNQTIKQTIKSFVKGYNLNIFQLVVSLLQSIIELNWIGFNQQITQNSTWIKNRNRRKREQKWK